MTNINYNTTISSLVELVRYREIANYRRGAVLGECIKLERKIDEFLAWYFTNNNKIKREELLGLILYENGIPFKRKIDLFREILFKRYKSIYTPAQKTLKKLDEIKNKRNIFAHRVLNEANYSSDLKKEHSVFLENNSFLGENEGERPYRCTPKHFAILITDIDEVFLFVNAMVRKLQVPSITKQ